MNFAKARSLEAVHTHTHTHTSISKELNKKTNKPYLIKIGFINNIKNNKDGLFLKVSRLLKNSLSFLCALEVINTKDKYA